MSATYHCDKCHAELDGKRTTLKAARGRVKAEHPEGVHLCTSCADELLSGFLAGPKAKAETSAKTDTPRKARPRGDGRPRPPSAA